MGNKMKFVLLFLFSTSLILTPDFTYATEDLKDTKALKATVDLKGYQQLCPIRTKQLQIHHEGSELYAPHIGFSFTKYKDRFLTANYRNIYCTDKKMRSLTRVAVLNKEQLPIWNPTDVYYLEATQHLYVANSTGNNILIFSIQETPQPTLVLISSIDGLNEPLGVYPSKDVDRMAIANYGAGELRFLHWTTQGWDLQWKKENLPACIGCLILNNRVYASGLEFISCYDYDGTQLFRKSQLFGHNFRFVTSIKPTLDEKRLLVVDGRLGYVFMVTPDLEEIMYFGGNGPSLFNFSMPYSAFEFQDKEIMVPSPYQDRIARIDLTSFKCKSLLLRHNNWGWVVGHYPLFSSRVSNESDNLMGLPPTSLFGLIVAPSYAYLQCPNKRKTILMPNYINPLNPDSYAHPHYFVSYAKDSKMTLILSNSSSTGILYDQRTHYLEFIDLGSVDCWGNLRTVYTPAGPTEMGRYKFTRHTPEEYQQRLPFPSVEAIADFIGLKPTILHSKFSHPDLKNSHSQPFDPMKLWGEIMNPHLSIGMDILEIFTVFSLKDPVRETL